MCTAISASKKFRFSVFLALLILGCKKNSFKDFSAFRQAPSDVRQSEIIKILEQANINDNTTVDSQLNRLLAEDQIVTLLDKQLPTAGFADGFGRVVTLAYQAFQPIEPVKNIQDAKGNTQWFLNQYGVEATESFLTECERLGGNVSANRAAVAEFKKAQEEEKHRRFEATWGSFSAWSARPENAQSRNDIKALFNGDSELSLLRAAYNKEKAGNDRQVRPSRIIREPIYPEVTGAFGFVKILSRDTSESLFSASDGLFVLRLSEGASFRAYPGQSVQMTMHSRGEKMSMTNGSLLPVFLSGPSPTEPKEIPGYEPNRSEENRLAESCSEKEKQLERIRQSLRDDGSGRFVLEEAKPVRLVFDRKGTAWQRVVIQDTESGKVMYCASVNNVDHPAGSEMVPIQRMLGNSGDSNENPDSTIPVVSDESFPNLPVQTRRGFPSVQSQSASKVLKDKANLANQEGENAFRMRQYERAAQLFKEATELDPEFGLAYGNLGFTYQKVGQLEEALSANQKALEVASGPKAALVKACSNFNNGTIYEGQGRLQDALRSYEAAAQLKPKAVYEQAANRIKGLLGQ